MEATVQNLACPLNTRDAKHPYYEGGPTSQSKREWPSLTCLGTQLGFISCHLHYRQMVSWPDPTLSRNWLGWQCLGVAMKLAQPSKHSKMPIQETL